MPAKRKYNIRGTKDFIVLSGIFFFLCLWSVKDAWYPSEKVVKKHPKEVSVAFETAGSIGQMHVQTGDSIGETQLLAELRQVKMQNDFDVAKKAYTTAKGQYALADEALRNAVKNDVPTEEVAELKQVRIDAEALMGSSLEDVTAMRARLDSSELRAPSKGVVKDVLVMTHGQVEAGQTVILIDPKDHFYLFNKSLAIFSFIAFWVFLGIHILAQ